MFGGGKVIRESMGQARTTRGEGTPDLVITGAVVLDHWGVVKADVGMRDGRIVALGKAGNPDTMDGVHPELVIGPSTEIIAGNGLILTAGAVDCHVHLICPTRSPEALGSGITTLIGGGTGPAEGTKATTVTPGRLVPGPDAGGAGRVAGERALLGKGNTVGAERAAGAAAGRRRRVQAARGLGHHARPRSTPACGWPTQTGVQVAIHTDTLNEAGFVEDTLRRDRAAGRSTRTTPRARAAGTRRTSSPSPAQPQRAARRRPTRPGRTPSTPSPSTSTC